MSIKITKGMEGFVEVLAGHLPAADYLLSEQVEALKKIVEQERKHCPTFNILHCEYIDNKFYVLYGWGTNGEYDNFIEIFEGDHPSLFDWNLDQWATGAKAFHAD